jgi:hypothetical protein
MKRIVIPFLFFGLASCASLTVTSDYDKNADFAKYRTYAFTEESTKLPVGELNADRIISAVEKELGAKGFSKSENPDILVDVLLKSKKRVEATATNSGGYYGRWGYGHGYPSTTYVNVNEYTDGSLFITFIDKSIGKIVWQGVGTKTVDETATAKERESNINYAVKSIIAKYPPKLK